MTTRAVKWRPNPTRKQIKLMNSIREIYVTGSLQELSEAGVETSCNCFFQRVSAFLCRNAALYFNDICPSLASLSLSLSFSLSPLEDASTRKVNQMPASGTTRWPKKLKHLPNSSIHTERLLDDAQQTNNRNPAGPHHIVRVCHWARQHKLVMCKLS